MARQQNEVTVDIRTKGMRNLLSKRRGSVNKNLTGCLQRCVILGYERKRKYLIFNTNNTVLQIQGRPEVRAVPFNFGMS
jgi:hypothetical protein